MRLPQSAWNSAALSERTSFQAVQCQEFDFTAMRGWLVPGTNWLAIQALNVHSDEFRFSFPMRAGDRDCGGNAATVPAIFFRANSRQRQRLRELPTSGPFSAKSAAMPLLARPAV